MATKPEVLKVVQLLVDAFGVDTDRAKQYSNAYPDLLKDIPAPTLIKAAQEWITSQKWFPKVAELRTIARRIEQMGCSAIEEHNRQQSIQDYQFLNMKRQELENRYYQNGELDEDEWFGLIEQYESANRFDGAASIRERLSAILGARIVVVVP
jgi:hypothetical protein